MLDMKGNEDNTHGSNVDTEAEARMSLMGEEVGLF